MSSPQMIRMFGLSAIHQSPYEFFFADSEVVDPGTGDNAAKLNRRLKPGPTPLTIFNEQRVCVRLRSRTALAMLEDSGSLAIARRLFPGDNWPVARWRCRLLVIRSCGTCLFMKTREVL